LTLDGLSALAGAEQIDASWCPFISDRGIRKLKGVQNIGVRGCPFVSDEAIASLAGPLRVVMMTEFFQMTYKGVKKIPGLKKVRSKKKVFNIN
jgi:hypothetical protein